jgi:hypothetical protein
MKFKNSPILLINLLFTILFINCSQKSETKLNEDGYSEEVNDVNTSNLNPPLRNPRCENHFDVKYGGEKMQYTYTYHRNCPYWEEKFDEFLKGIESNEPKVAKIDNYQRLTAYVQNVYQFPTLEEAKADYVKYHKKRSYLERISQDLNSNKENIQGNNWTINDKKKFKEDCLKGLVDANSQLSSTSRNEYCDCVLEKMMLEYPDKNSSQDLNWIKKTAKGCLVKLINK